MRTASEKSFKKRLAQIIFETDTPAGKIFDVSLIISILLSVVVVLLDSVNAIRLQFGILFWWLEWLFTLIFTVEYICRLYCASRPAGYAISFFGIVDLFAILPTYLSLVFPGSQVLIVIRILRVLRVFRVLKLAKYLSEANLLIQALFASRRKIFVFVFTVLSLVIIFGSLMYVIEPESSGFTSIPRSIYWAIVTLTTVGYGDISPQTNLGQTLAAFIMILGYGIIAVPTGIVTVEMSKISGKNQKTFACSRCSTDGHVTDAIYCSHCGDKLRR